MDFSVLQAIFDSMEQGVVFIDAESRIAYCNPAAEKIRKIERDQFFGRSILDCHPCASHPKVSQIIEDLRSGKKTGHHRMNLQLVEGKFYDNTYSAVWGPRNEYLGVTVVTQEVTQRKMAETELKETLNKLQTANEELQNLSKAKDDFLSNVSHELKTPMISVMGYVGMLLGEKVGSLTEQQKRFLEISYKNMRRLEKNIDNLLDMAELKIAREPWTFETVDLSKVIEFSCSTVEPLAKEHQIRIQVQPVPNPVMAFGAGDKLNQLFDNLLINAVKYNRQGGKIEINFLENDQSAFVRISDTGVGISHESLKEVFTRHFQEKAKPLGNVKGLGIGLSLAQEIVHRHRGEIYVESKVGKGSTFTVRLPKLPAKSPEEIP